MSTQEQARILVERGWIIVPESSQQEIDLHLMLCTGIFFYGSRHKEGPYLVAHSGPTQGGGLPELVMNEVMNKPEFNGMDLSDDRISLNDIIAPFRTMLDPYESIGVFLASGIRALPTDLAFVRYFMLTPGYKLMGAEMNRMNIARLSPHDRKISFHDPVTIERFEDSPIIEIGQKYDPNLRLYP